MTEIVHELRHTGGHYSSIAAYFAHLASTDFTAASTRVFSHGGVTGSISPGAVLEGRTSAATGVVVGVVTGTQVLLKSIAGTFSSGEVCEVQGATSNTLTLSDAGATAELRLSCYDGDYGGTNGALNETAQLASSVVLGPSNGLTIEAPAGEGPEGVWGSGFWMEHASSYCLRIFPQYVKVINIGFTNSSNGFGCVEHASPLGSSVERCMVEASGNGKGILQLGHPSTTVTNFIVRLNHVRGVANGPGIALTRGVTVQNNTVIDCPGGGISGIQVLYNNNVVYGTGTTFSSSIEDAGSSHNASQDTSAPGTNQIHNLVAANDFASYPADVTPEPGGALDGAGADLSGQFTTDIKGATYPVPFDVGAYSLGAITSTLTFDGPNVADVAATGGQAYSQNTASKWSTNAPTVTYAKTGTAWPAGIDLNTSTGEINGTPGPSDVGTTSGHTITASDSYGGSVASNAFDITVVAPALSTYDPAHPADVTVNDGQQATFTPVVLSGPAISAHVWQELPPAGSWANISPTVGTESLVFNAGLAQDGYQYRRADIDEYSRITTSPEALLTVEVGGVTFAIDKADITVTTYDLVVAIAEAPVRTVSGSGACEAQSATAAGEANQERNVMGSGAVQAGSATSSGQAQRFRVIQGSGAATAQSAQASGQNDREIVGSGNCQAQAAACSGEREFISAKFVFGVKKENGR
jgi:hypothetical protein